MAFHHRHSMANQDSRGDLRPERASSSSTTDVEPAREDRWRSDSWSLIENLPVCVTVLRQDGVVVLANKGAASVTGYEVEEMIGRAFWTEAVHPEDRPKLIRAQRQVSEGAEATVAVRCLTKAGGSRRLKIRLIAASLGGEPLIECVVLDASERGDVEGGTVGGVLMAEDRTDEKRREDELQLQSRYAAAESALRKAALAGGGEAAFLEEAARILGEGTHAARVYLMTNNAAGDCCIRRACWVRSGVEEAAPLLLMHDELPVLRDLIRDRCSIHAGGRALDGASEDLLRLTGAREAIWSPFYDETRLGGLVVFERDDADHDERVSAWQEAETRLAEQIVRQFETLWSWMQAGTRYHQITRTIEDCLFTYTFDEDGERRFLFLTPQVERLTGYTAAEIIGCALEGGLWTDVVVLEADQRLVDGHDDTLRRGGEGRVAYRVRHADGSVRWVQEQARCEVDGMGDVIVRGIMTDVTEQKTAEQVLTDATQQAESVARLKSAFIATMSHEIRTPMGALNGFAELLARELAELEETGVTLPPQVVEFLDAVRENSKRLLTLVNDLFDLSNLEDGSIDVHGRAVSFHEILTRSTSKIAAPLSRKGVELRVDLADRDPMVRGDARRLEQVMDNLLSNAVKFTHQGYVQIRTRIEDEWIVAEVADSGIGIADRSLGRLFEPFVQEDSRLNRTFEGSGLGLTLVKRLLALMEGDIEAESTKGEGSLFRIRLPECTRRERQDA